jgi:SAM-dependent methyltransferase
MKTLNQQQYDQLWTEAWGDMQRLGPVHRRQREELLKLIAKLQVKTVLDVGCGSGDNLAGLAQSFPSLELSGVDVSAEALALAVQRVPHATLRKLDAQVENLNERFDLVMSIQVIEHLADDVAALRNMALMARKWVLVTTMRGRMRKSERAIGHLRNYSTRELNEKAASAGLEVVDIVGWGFPFYSPLYRTIAEWLPGGPPQGKIEAGQRVLADFLYRLYALNIPRRGDVVTVLARPLSSVP